MTFTNRNWFKAVPRGLRQWARAARPNLAHVLDRLVSPICGTRALMALLWRADRRLFLTLGVLTAVLGVLPNLLVLSTGWFTNVAAGAVREGLWSPAGRHALTALAVVGICFALNSALVAYVRWGTQCMNTAFVGQFSKEVGVACLSRRYVDFLEDPQMAGEVSALADFERSGVHMEAVPATRMVLSRRIGGVGAAAILFALSWWAPLLMTAAWYAARWGSSRWVERGFNTARAEGGGRLRRAQYLRDLALGPGAAKELRIFGWASWVGDQYAATWRAAMSRVWAARHASTRDLAIGLVAIVGAHLVVFGWIGWRAWSGQLGIGGAVTLGLAVLGTADLGFLGDQEWRLKRAAQLALQLQWVRHHAEVEADSLAVGPEPSRGEQEPGRRGAPVRITLDDVRFTYAGSSNPVLEDINLEIPAGQSVAIVGENGAGKSTLLKLLAGLYKVQHGAVRLDGRDVHDLDARCVRRRVGIIFQDFLRYELPLRENVGFGDLSLLHNETELAGALRDAGGSELFASLPAGWDTVLARGYEDGVDLSGGQWQKVALARALTAVRAGAGVLILDEPTAALDVRAEADLFERFLEVTRDLTTILVSHRLSGVRRADRIVVLDQGRIVEDGTHEELMATDGRYSRMFRLQADRFGADSQALTGRADRATPR